MRGHRNHDTLVTLTARSERLAFLARAKQWRDSAQGPVFLIAPRRRELASWHNVELEEGVRGRFRNGASPGLNGGKIDDAIGDGPPDLHWQVDAEDSVFAKRAAIPARASAPTARPHLATDADAKSSSTRIERLGVEARDAVEGNCRRILPYGGRLLPRSVACAVGQNDTART